MPHRPTRMCVICRQRFDKAALKRHVLSSEGRLVQDVRQIMPGRGWYVCSQPACEERFQKYKTGQKHKKGRTAPKGQTGQTGYDKAQGGLRHE